MDGSGPGPPEKLPPYPRLKRPPEQSGRPTPFSSAQAEPETGSYGDPVLEWRRPGGSVQP